MRPCGALPLLIALAGCPVVAGVPPTRTEVAPVTTLAEGRHQRGLRLATGVHWASTTLDRATGYDGGAGYLYEVHDRAPEAASMTTDLSPVPAPGPPRGLHGIYLEAARRLAGGRHQRSWVGARTELLLASVDGSTRVGAGAGVRLSWEVFSAGTHVEPVSEPRAAGVGIAHGVTGIGAYLDAGYRWLPEGGHALVATAGLTVRLPSLVFIGVVIPDF